MQEDVRSFMLKMGMPVKDSPRLPEQEIFDGRMKLIEEEVRELREAYVNKDLPEFADALTDLLYVVFGTACSAGITINKHWAVVHHANSTKVPGITKRGMAYDATKPPGWSPPDNKGILQGFNSSEEDIKFLQIYINSLEARAEHLKKMAKLNATLMRAIIEVDERQGVLIKVDHPDSV